MPVFISYAHADARFVTKLAARLVKHRAHVWVDKWELKEGDSIVSRVQEAIQGPSALIVILSRASVASGWCKNELAADLVRELEGKGCVVLPVLREDCDVPASLRDKVRADFRKDFRIGLKDVLAVIAGVTSDALGRTERPDYHVDWGLDWGYDNGCLRLGIMLAEQSIAEPHTIVTEIFVFANDVATKRYARYERAGLAWAGRLMMLEVLVDLARREELGVRLVDQSPRSTQLEVRDPKLGASYRIVMRARRLGQDSGKEIVVSLSRQIEAVYAAIHSRTRKPTDAESEHLGRIAAGPPG